MNSSKTGECSLWSGLQCASPFYATIYTPSKKIDEGIGISSIG